MSSKFDRADRVAVTFLALFLTAVGGSTCLFVGQPKNPRSGKP